MAKDRLGFNKSNFIQDWLVKKTPLQEYTHFVHIPLAEKEKVRKVACIRLAEVIFIHHNDPEEFREDVTLLGYPESANTFDKRPRCLNTRMCNFGEILATEYLRQHEGYRIPIYRLRYNPNPESPMKGDDVLAFKFGEPDGSGREILIIESKVRSQFTTKVIKEAYEQLKSGHRPRPKSILFVLTILRNEGRKDEEAHVLKFLDKFARYQPSKGCMIFLITGNKTRNPFKYIQDHRQVIKNLKAVDIFITNLKGFVNTLFNYKVKINGT